MLDNPRWQRFCNEYLVDLNASAAYGRAGYKATGAARDTGGSDLLRNPEIQAEIQRLIADRAKRTEVTSDRVLRELALLAFSNIEDYRINERGRIRLASGAVSPDAVRAVSRKKFKQTTDRFGNVTSESEIHLWPKAQALEMCMRHLGMGQGDIDLERVLAILGPLGEEARRFLAGKVPQAGSEPPTT